MSRVRPRLFLVGILSLCLVATGAACGGGGDDDDGGGSDATATTRSGGGGSPTATTAGGGALPTSTGGGSAADFDPCGLLTQDEVDDALGEPADGGDASGPVAPLGMRLCTWGVKAETRIGIAQVSVVRTADMDRTLRDRRYTAKQLFEDSKDLNRPFDTVAGVGEDAYRHGKILEVYGADAHITIDVSPAGNADVGTDLLVALATKVLDRLPK